MQEARHAVGSFLERHRQERPRMTEVVSVDAGATRLQCPLCSAALPDDAEKNESDSNYGGTGCPLHRAASRFAAGCDAAEVEQLVGEGLQQISWWSSEEKREFLEVLCGVAGMHTLETVTRDHLRLDSHAGRPCYDSLSYAGFATWFRDKLARASRHPYYRYECAMRIRRLWSQHPEGRELERALVAAREAAAPAEALVWQARDRVAGCLKGVSGLRRSIEKGAEKEKMEARAKSLAEKEAALAAEQARLAEAERIPALEELRRAEEQWQQFLHRDSELGAAMARLEQYNKQVANIRSGSIGKEGLLFEHECGAIAAQLFNGDRRPGVRLLRSVKLRGVQFPEFASSEFDCWVVEGNEVLAVVEMKRSCGAVRGNLTKKLSALSYLQSEAFGGTEYEGVSLTRSSFSRFAGDGFFQNMYFFAREPVKVRDDEDVYAVFLDNDDAFLTALMDVPGEVESEAFIASAWLFVQDKYPMTDQDMADYRTGSAAFLKSVEHGRVLLVKHLLRPEKFGLPRRHKSSVRTSQESLY